MANRDFVGFSTADSEFSRERTFYDLELCVRDLKLHFNTRPGERVMRPEWGCGVWNYAMEPLTPGLKQLIADEALAVVNADNRCVAVSANISEIDHGFTIEITMDYKPASVAATFSVEFDSRSATFFS